MNVSTTPHSLAKIQSLEQNVKKVYAHRDSRNIPLIFRNTYDQLRDHSTSLETQQAQLKLDAEPRLGRPTQWMSQSQVEVHETKVNVKDKTETPNPTQLQNNALLSLSDASVVRDR